MNAPALAAIACLCSACAAWAQGTADPIHTDGDKYRVLLENERVRVLAYSDAPGEKTLRHQHPAFVVYALAPFKRRLTLGDGRQVEREFKAGDVMYSNGEEHIGENIGTTPTQVLLVEIKPAPAARP